ncbi:hypothetical protein T484DRAFT_1780981 [Baffinella frigidus]|nr:hypothetical protein T484DRAFT_1780981 [Cryptophyta sp. CCMP2293]
MPATIAACGPKGKFQTQELEAQAGVDRLRGSARMVVFYSRRLGGLPLFTRIRGSPVVSGGVVGPAAFAALLGGVLEFYSQRDPAFQEYFDTSMNHPYPYQIFATVLGFALVFRTNSALARYWGGIGMCRGLDAATEMCTQMTSRWLDAATEVSAFLRCRDTEQNKAVACRFVHLMSLLHALAVQELRGDTL